jgi:histidinol-phosphatase (PHP family)
MKTDLHNHTPLCNHAEGEMEAFVQKAIEKDINVFGFSDHAPMNFDPKYRMTFDQMKPYEDEIARLKQLYQNNIEILRAYEVDYIPNYLDERVLNADVDYLIGSVHFIDEWGFDNPEFIGGYKDRDIDEIWEKYFSLIEQMAQSGLFQIVGHIDLIKVFKFLPKRPIAQIAQPALKAIKKAGMSLELNSAGYDKPIGEAYPTHTILEEAFKLDIPITFGSDAHNVEQIDRHREIISTYAKSIGYTQSAIYRNKTMVMVPFD